jgi:hypothetical protein
MVPQLVPDVKLLSDCNPGVGIGPPASSWDLSVARVVKSQQLAVL